MHIYMLRVFSEAYNIHILFNILSISVVYLLQVNYLHSHGLAHTELRLENIHISPLDRHIKVRALLYAPEIENPIQHQLFTFLITLFTIALGIVD